MATTASKSARRTSAAAKKAPAKKTPARKAAPRAARAASKANGAAAPQRAAVAAKPPKLKLVRDSFTIPRDEYVVIEVLKTRAAKAGRIAKKSELLRAGLKLLAASTDAGLVGALEAVPSVKTGRPKGKRHGKDHAADGDAAR